MLFLEEQSGERSNRRPVRVNDSGGVSITHTRAAFSFGVESTMSSFKDSKGRKFSARVQVYSSLGRYIRHITGERASQLVASSLATYDGSSKERIWRIDLQRSTALLPRQKPTPLSLRNYTGQRYTKGERPTGERVITQFRHIHKQDRWAFVLAQSDTITRFTSRESLRNFAPWP